MNFDEYQKLANITAKKLSFDQDLVHSALGLASEAGEFTSAVKAYVIYEKRLDVMNCKEELGDILWFVARACSVLKLSMADVSNANIEKLKKRYGEKYSDQAALDRADKVEEVK